MNTRVFFLFTLKLKRLREWFCDLRAEKPGLSEFYLMGMLMLRIFLYPRTLAVKRRVYFHRLSVCHRCPIFDKRLKRCRNGEQGCGCYIPFKALAPVDGWLREQGKSGCWGMAEYCGK